MRFCSVYNKDTPLDKDRNHFDAVDPTGKVYKVHEYVTPDKRRTSGQRLVREDYDTGKSLFGIPLHVLPKDFNFEAPNDWMMLQILKLMEKVQELETEVEYRKDDVEKLESVVRNLDPSGVLYPY